MDDLLHRLGELAADLLAAPESYERQRRLAEAVAEYDRWRTGRWSVFEDIVRGI